MSNGYNEKVIEVFSNPKNVGKLDNADGVGTVGNATCGDIMKIYLKIENNVIVDAKFQTFGCAAAIATSSTATEMIIGKTVDEAQFGGIDYERWIFCRYCNGCSYGCYVA